MSVQVAQAQPRSLSDLLKCEDYKRRFNELLGKKAAGFMSSILTVANGDNNLKNCDPKQIIAAAAIAASMDLPIDKNLGFAYIVAYKGQPSFQMGYRGYIQLAMRTGQYKTINACEVYEGEIKSMNRFTGEIELNPDGKTSDTIVGYLAYFKLINGFEKYHYLTVDEIKRHAQKYSQGYGKSWSRWTSDFGPMAIKTVLKQLLSKYGILSIDMQTGLMADQAHVKDGDNGPEFEYPDANEIKNITPTQDLNSRLDAADQWGTDYAAAEAQQAATSEDEGLPL